MSFVATIVATFVTYPLRAGLLRSLGAGTAPAWSGPPEERGAHGDFAGGEGGAGDGGGAEHREGDRAGAGPGPGQGGLQRPPRPSCGSVPAPPRAQPRRGYGGRPP